MGVLHGLLIVGAIGLIAVAPCLVCLLLISADEMLERCWRAVRRNIRRRSAPGGRWTETWLGRRWQLSRRGPQEVTEVTAVDRWEPACPTIEQVATDLRRLNRLRGGIALRSPVWFNAVQRAYDEGLRVACGQLEVEEHLNGLTGVDLDLERLRLEGELQRAGLVLRDAGAQQR